MPAVIRKLSAAAETLRKVWRYRSSMRELWRNRDQVKELQAERRQCDECVIAIGDEGRICDEHTAFVQFIMDGGEDESGDSHSAASE